MDAIGGLTVARTGIADEPCLVVDLVVCIDGVGNKSGISRIILAGPIVEKVRFNSWSITPVAVKCKIGSGEAFAADLVKCDEAFNIDTVLKIPFDVPNIP